MNRNTKFSAAAFGAALLAVPGSAGAVDIDTQGIVRLEVAPKVNSEENPYNQQGNLFNGRTVTRDSSAIGGFTDNVTRVNPIGSTDNAFNLFAVRGELDFSANFSPNLSGVMKIRGFVDPGIYDDDGNTDFFQVPFFSGDRATRLEISGDNYMVDIPALYLDYIDGPLWLRVGNQQIAWGESLFFRVLDVPNGLDLRRHFILDWVAEEYADERIASPGIRGSYRVFGDTEIEAFGQMFNPTILPNENTPYNLIAAQFDVHQEEGFDDVKNQWNFGGRVQTKIGDLGLQFIGVSRRNPDGVFRWTKSGINRDLPGAPGSGAILAETPFEVNPTDGVVSHQEWFTYAGMARLNGVTALNSAVNDFQPATGLLGAFPVPNTDMALASQELDLFFQLSGGLRGHIERYYPREEIFGIGANYIIFDEPGSLLDQLVIRGEATYTPNKKFTNPSLGAEPIETDEIAASLVLEKYHRFTDSFPATFMVFQYLFKSESDLFGRYLGGNGGSQNMLPTGQGSFNALVFAVQQPFPNLIWRADLSVLADVKGGALIQPGLRWKPTSDFGVEMYGNLTLSNGKNDNIIETIDWADEIGLRVTFQF